MQFFQCSIVNTKASRELKLTQHVLLISHMMKPWLLEMLLKILALNMRLDCDFNDLVENFDSMVYHCDNLMANPAMLPNFLLSRRAHKDLKVVLHGGGGDEMFFGYPTYVADTLLKYFRHMFLLAGPIKLALSFFPASFEKLSTRYKFEKFLEGAGLTSERAHYHWRTIFS